MTIKSTGTLIDEMYTAELKADAGSEAASDRRHALGIIVMTRMLPLITDMAKHREFHRIMRELKDVLKQCWDAQEIVANTEMDTDEHIRIIAEAGKRAQITNAARNKLIRQLDALLGEESQLEKTYDKG